MNFFKIKKPFGDFLSVNLALLLILLMVSACSKTELQTPETKIEVVESKEVHNQARLGGCMPVAASNVQALITSLNNYSVCLEGYQDPNSLPIHTPDCAGVNQGITMPFPLKHPVSLISFPLSRSAVRSFYNTVVATYSSDISTLYDGYCGGASSKYILDFEFVNTTNDIFCEPHIRVNNILYTCCY